jgi:hypothetical protein
VRRSPFAKNKSELALRISVSRPTLSKLFKLSDHPENHGESANKYDVEKWRAFASEQLSAHNRGNARNQGNGSNGHLPVNERDASVIEKNRVSAERDRFRLSKEKGECLLVVEVTKALDTKLGVVVRELYKAFEQEMPAKLEGMSALEIKKALSRKLESVFRDLQKIV